MLLDTAVLLASEKVLSNSSSICYYNLIYRKRAFSAFASALLFNILFFRKSNAACIVSSLAFRSTAKGQTVMAALGSV